NNLRRVTGRRDFFSVRVATTDRVGGSGTAGGIALGRVCAGALRFAAGLGEPEGVAGVSISGASGTAAGVEAETMAPMRVGNFGSGIKGVLLWFWKSAAWIAAAFTPVLGRSARPLRHGLVHAGRAIRAAVCHRH